MAGLTGSRVFELLVQHVSFLKIGSSARYFVVENWVVRAGFMRVQNLARSPISGWTCGGLPKAHTQKEPSMGVAGISTRRFHNYGNSNSVRYNKKRKPKSSIPCNHTTAGLQLGKVSVHKRSGNGKYAMLWRDLLADPSNWWDNRVGKPNERFPDFKHKQSGEGLWLDREHNPPWVASEVACIKPGVSIFSRSKTLSGYNKVGQYEKTMEFFEQMQHEGLKADEYEYIHVLNACAGLQVLEEGRRIHGLIVEAGCESDLYVASSLVDMYAKCGSVDDARRIFDKMPIRNVVTWTAMILGCAKNGQGQEALDLFQCMQRDGVEPESTTFVALLNACACLESLEEGKRVHKLISENGCESSVYVGNSLVDMYAKCGSIDDARSVFNKMFYRNVVSWNTMIQGCVNRGQVLEALDLFQQMQPDGVEPNSTTFVALLNACASAAALAEGRLLHRQIIRNGCEANVCVGSALVDMYAKCGSIKDAKSVFDNMPTRDVVAWTAMILGFAMHGLAKEAVALFEEMSLTGSEMNEITFIGLLSACGHGGLVKEAMQYFECMQSVYGVSPTQAHYTCMVDILGRAGQLDVAEKMIRTMPFPTPAAVWVSLLSACRIHENLEMGERAAQQVMKLDPENSAGYVLLSNIYASAGQF